MNKIIYKAESLISLLIAMSIFGIIYLVQTKWLSQQQHNAEMLYQKQQALEIAENQLSLLMAQNPCEKIVRQNHLIFQIDCRSQQIQIRFPQGHLSLEKE